MVMAVKLYLVQHGLAKSENEDLNGHSSTKVSTTLPVWHDTSPPAEATPLSEPPPHAASSNAATPTTGPTARLNVRRPRRLLRNIGTLPRRVHEHT
jgi:hypothetical protein